MKRAIFVLSALTLSLMGCGGGGGSSSKNVVQTPPAEEKQTLTINGIATDAPLAGADVTLMLDGVDTDILTTTDNDGNYSIKLEFLKSDLDKFVSLKAMGTGPQATAGLISLVGELEELVEDAGADEILVASENFAVTVSHITTAKYGLLVEAHESEEVHSKAILKQYADSFSQHNILTLATAIKVAIDKAGNNPELALPPGFDHTLELMRYSEVMNEYVNSVLLSDEFSEAQKETLDDPSIYDSTLTFPTSFELYFVDFDGNDQANHAFKFNADNTGKYQNVAFTWEHNGSTIDIAFAEQTYKENFIFEDSSQKSIRRLTGFKNINLRIVSETEETLGLAVQYTIESQFPDHPERDSELQETSALVTATMQTYLISFATPSTLHIPLADAGEHKGLRLNTDEVDYDVLADRFTFNADGTAVGEVTGITVSWTFDEDALVLDFISSTNSWISDYGFPFTSMAIRKVSNDNFVDKVQISFNDANGEDVFGNVYQASLNEKQVTWKPDEIPGIYAFEFDYDGSPLNQHYFVLHENGDADTIYTQDRNKDGALVKEEVTRDYGRWTLQDNQLMITQTMLRGGERSEACRTPGFLADQQACLLYHERELELINQQDNAFFLLNNDHVYFENIYGDIGSTDGIRWDLRRLHKTPEAPVDLTHL
ncbi:carboxypeptidase-like regulatory domain-containing protein [Alteromonas ponticola]|uniref:Carboxypeptidase regulatory-like domain-containing protein n=1 Tax=Alteromonas ponticola TaxID=2720613 RepID=A0ABX1QX17_9ALTE|nr:carboxypeptidase-like regulatory domain-containing protein [Alteromonas ponticola]NMH58787.1 carboxypeptidase regulatory-like domain-containing protein [Alteromonas ponticola]